MTKTKEVPKETPLEERREEMLKDFYAMDMNFAAVGKKYGVSRQRAHQILSDAIDPEKVKAIKEKEEQEIVEAFLDTGSYRKAVERVDAGTWRVREVVKSRLTDEQIEAARAAHAGEPTEPKDDLVFKVFNVYDDQVDYLEEVGNVSSTVRAGLKLLVNMKNADELIEKQRSIAGDDDAGLRSEKATAYITKDQSDILDSLAGEERGMKAAVLRAAVEIARSITEATK